jgi:signal peptidase I
VTEENNASATQDGPASGRRRRRRSFWRELPFLALIALVLAVLIRTFLIQAFFIPSGSMEPTLHGCRGCSGDRVLVNKLVYRVRDPHRGEIVVFRGPPSWQDTVEAKHDKDLIKRVVGVAGDHVICCDPQGRITVDGQPLTEPYIFPGADPSDQQFDVIVPQGRLWVMGDHRDDSADSRAHLDDEDGTIPVGDVIGRAFVKVWPPSRWGLLPVPRTFQQPGLRARHD